MGNSLMHRALRRAHVLKKTFDIVLKIHEFEAEHGGAYL